MSSTGSPGSAPSNTPSRPAASRNAAARYGFAAESTARFSTAGRLRGSRNMHDRLLSPYAAHTGAHETQPSLRRGTSRLYEFTVGVATAAIAPAWRRIPATNE